MIISVIIPTYNRAIRVTALAREFLSIGDQSLELIVVDDGSTDNTYEELAEISDYRLKVIYVPNGERGRARNIGASHAKGDYINFFDSDDRPKSNHFQVAEKILASTNYPDWLILGFDVQESNGLSSRPRLPSPKKDFLSVLQHGNPLSPNSIFLKRCIVKAYPFAESRDLAGSEDYELWLRLALRCTPVYYPDVITCTVQQWAGRSVNNISPEKCLAQFCALTKALNLLHWPKDLKHYKHKVYAGNCMYFSLQFSSHLGSKHLSVWLLLISLLHDFSLLSSKRPYAVLKHLLLSFQ